MKMPTPDEIDIAILWLYQNDGELEQGACQRVADWIEHLDTEAMLRKIARESGVTVARLRRKVAERNQSSR